MELLTLLTKHFGIIDVEEKMVINFPEGLPGFEDMKKFIILDKSEDDIPFQWLQSVDNTDLAFVVIDPFIIKPDYKIDVDDSEIDILKIKDDKQVLVFSIVVVPESINDMTANLKAPIIINLENMKGKQVVLRQDNYEVKYKILKGVKQETGGK